MTDLRNGETEVERYCMRSYFFFFFFSVLVISWEKKKIKKILGVFPSPRFEYSKFGVAREEKVAEVVSRHREQNKTKQTETKQNKK